MAKWNSVLTLPLRKAFPNGLVVPRELAHDTRPGVVRMAASRWIRKRTEFSPSGLGRTRRIKRAPKPNSVVVKGCLSAAMFLSEFVSLFPFGVADFLVFCWQAHGPITFHVIFLPLSLL
jgi:hypothetical protein